VTTQHRINETAYYELFYNNYSGFASVSESGFGDNANVTNPPDYVWEYVVKCTEQTQPCDPSQVNAFYLRKCPGGTRLVNATIGSNNFDLLSQQCVPCGPLKYIVDPGSGGSCQECPKGAFCPDGDLFVPKPVESEWEIIWSGPRGLDAVKRVVSCPPGYYMFRDEKYPLEDQCVRCEASTYLLDRNNFSACLNCPQGATCAGGEDVTALQGFWRQPDVWSKNWTMSRRSGSDGLWNDGGEMPPFFQRVSIEIKNLLQQMRAADSSSSSPSQRRAGNTNITGRPRSVIIHKCSPGDCSENNVCLRNRTGPACGLCPEGWAETAAGCEWCPPPDDPGLLSLKWAFFMGGGLVAVVGYLLAAWTPLINSLPIPQWMSNAIMWVVDFGSDHKEEEKKSDDESDSDYDDEGTAAGGSASGGKEAAAAKGEERGGESNTGGIKTTGGSNLKGNIKGGRGEGKEEGGSQGGCQSVTEGIKTIGRYGTRMLRELPKLLDYAQRNKITVHLKIIISYVQVPTRALCGASNHHRCMTNTRSDPLFWAGPWIICVIQCRVALGCFFCHEHKSCVSVQR
jgi:hypothetical protein